MTRYFYNEARGKILELCDGKIHEYTPFGEGTQGVWLEHSGRDMQFEIGKVGITDVPKKRGRKPGVKINKEPEAETDEEESPDAAPSMMPERKRILSPIEFANMKSDVVAGRMGDVDIMSKYGVSMAYVKLIRQRFKGE